MTCMTKRCWARGRCWIRSICCCSFGAGPRFFAAAAKILEVDPGNVRARIDIGDHYRNLDANDKAVEYYSEAVRVLQQRPKEETWKEDVEELLNAVALLTKHDRLAGHAKSLEAWCREALEASG
jgi:hypothetical protein